MSIPLKPSTQSVGHVCEGLLSTDVGSSPTVPPRREPDRKAIPLASFKPLLLRPQLLNPDELEDNLKLTKLLRDRLQEDSLAGTRGKPNAPGAVLARWLPQGSRAWRSLDRRIRPGMVRMGARSRCCGRQIR